MMTKLADLIEKPFYIAGIFSQEPAFQEKGIFLGSTIANITMADNPLICVDPDYGGTENHPTDLGNTHICDLKV